MHVWCSTQHPSEMQALVARALGWQSHQVVVECRRMGGGFGGKESQSALFAGVAAVCAARLGVPVKLRPDRDDDMMITGKRHGFHYEYDIGFDDAGHILGMNVDMTLQAGYSADLSEAVATRAVCHVDNAYFLPHIGIAALCGKTNTQSNTAFRGFGGPQGALVTEVLIDMIARRLGRDPLDVRRANFYGIGERDITPYGQRVLDNVLEPLVSQLEADSSYRARREAVQAYNRGSPVLKRALALTPVKFGISFNVPAFIRRALGMYTATARPREPWRHRNGPGLNTKVAQVTAQALGLDIAHVRVTAADTSKVANTRQRPRPQVRI